MPTLVKTSLAAVLTGILLVSGCGGGEDEVVPDDPAPNTSSESPTADPTPDPTPEPTPTVSAGSAQNCGAVTEESASQLYGRPVTVTGDVNCRFEEEDFLAQDLNVLWEFDRDVGRTFAQARQGLGVRSDDARRVVLAGGVPAWEVRTLDVPGVILTMVLGDDLLTVFSMVNLVHEPYRSIPELATIAYGIAETYTA